MSGPGGAATAFGTEVLALLEGEEEVEIETVAEDGTRHRTVIWVVVSDGAVYVRSVRGTEGRWYREVLAHPQGTLVSAGHRFAFRALAAADAVSVAACSRALRRKYAGDPSLRSMLVPDVLPTTLRLVPA